jgi:N-formylglutamate amidohydrolase
MTASNSFINLRSMSSSTSSTARQATVDDGILDLRRPPQQSLPLVLSSPHSGTDYPQDLLNCSRLDPMTLRRSEDSFVDQIFSAAPELGAPLLAARFPRAYLDVNREPWELDPAMFADSLPGFVNVRSPRVRMGLGTIAKIVASGEEIYARKLRFAEARQRVETLYQPYHHALRQLVEDTEAMFGTYLLIDCHSMPSSAGTGNSRDGADIVLGDCHGTACAPVVIEAARSFLASRRFSVALNTPYAGGFTTGHYGNPRLERHALQIEINRSIYMDERRYRRKSGFEALKSDMTGLLTCLAEVMHELLPGEPRLAAE